MTQFLEYIPSSSACSETPSQSNHSRWGYLCGKPQREGSVQGLWAEKGRKNKQNIIKRMSHTCSMFSYSVFQASKAAFQILACWKMKRRTEGDHHRQQILYCNWGEDDHGHIQNELCVNAICLWCRKYLPSPNDPLHCVLWLRYVPSVKSNHCLYINEELVSWRNVFCDASPTGPEQRAGRLCSSSPSQRSGVCFRYMKN